MRRLNKKAGILNQVISHIIIVGIIFAVFMAATAGKVNARDFRQQLIEKQIALFIDAGVPGMTYEIYKIHASGEINYIDLKDGKVFVAIDGLTPKMGYPYFTPYDVIIEEVENKYVIKIR